MQPVIRRAKGFEDVAACLGIRLSVFVAEQAVPLIEEVDDYDATATHYLACLGGLAVGTARLVRLDGSTGKIGRVAVLAAYRGAGLGSSLVQYIIANEGAAYPVLVLDSQVTAIGFYERFGFRATGGTFMDAGIPHRRMERTRERNSPAAY